MTTALRFLSLCERNELSNISFAYVSCSFFETGHTLLIMHALYVPSLSTAITVSLWLRRNVLTAIIRLLRTIAVRTSFILLSGTLQLSRSIHQRLSALLGLLMYVYILSDGTDAWYNVPFYVQFVYIFSVWMNLDHRDRICFDMVIIDVRDHLIPTVSVVHAMSYLWILKRFRFFARRVSLSECLCYHLIVHRWSCPSSRFQVQDWWKWASEEDNIRRQ